MALQRQLVLRLAGNTPGLRHQFAVLAHRQTGAGFAIARQFRLEVMQAQLRQRLEFVGRCLAAIDLQQDLPQVFVDADGRVGGGIDATGNAALNLTEGDLVRHQQRRFETGAAGLLNVVGRRLWRQPRTEHAFTGEVEITGVLEHRAGGYFAHAQAVQVEALDQTFQRSGQHFLIAGGGIRAVGACERNAIAADNGHASCLNHRNLPALNASIV